LEYIVDERTILIDYQLMHDSEWIEPPGLQGFIASLSFSIFEMDYQVVKRSHANDTKHLVVRAAGIHDIEYVTHASVIELPQSWLL
jgi:hypothetical protein